jgi:hypothetical protein
MKNCIGIILFVLIGIISSCSSYYTFEDFTSKQSNFPKRSVESFELGYSIVVPNSWRLMEKQHQGKVLIETFADRPNSSGSFSFLSIAKFKGNSNDLDKEIENLQKSQKLPDGLEHVALEKTKHLKYKSYYRHVKSDKENPEKADLITFMLKANEDSTFFTIMICAPQGDELLNDMNMLMNCAKQFAIK